MSTIALPTRGRTSRLVLYGETWETYLRLLRAFDERRHVRITFDRGALEIMTLSPRHEQTKRFLGKLVEALTEELGLPIALYGSLTLKRRRKKRGLEPDECYWIQNEAKVRRLVKFSFRRDPPPDLVLEVDITSSSLGRMSIYAAMRVPEVWRFDGKVVTFHVLGPDGRYVVQDRSVAFPSVTSQDINGFLALLGQMELNEILRKFREWVRQLPSTSTGPAAGTSP